MNKFFFSLIFLLMFQFSNAQVSTKYTISFENAVHHEAVIQVTFKDLDTDTIEFRMSRSSPGRYALHEFAKNVYNVKVTDSKGNILKTTRTDPYSWNVSGHDGTIHVRYNLFANHADGTYTQIDETHAHMNAPATFMFAPSLANNEIEITFDVRNDLNWKIATQLKHQKGNTYYAKNLQYFMDSPIEISNHNIRSFDVDGQTINFALHHTGTEAEFDTFFESVKKIVLQQKAIFGELPDFDYGEYTFLACYMPQVTGDAMEHRNSTFLTTTRSLADGGIHRNLGSVTHEFFHGWNVERIRPKTLEPFDFTQVNMSNELWFAEGFTEYYGDFTLCRAGLTSQEDYILSLRGSFNYVWNSTGRNFYNAIEMSNQAPFQDAAKSIDPTNSRNLFISYYHYGKMIALGLDLSLREQNLNLDDYMKLVWKTYGKTEIPYTIQNLNETLNTYAGAEFGNLFFNNYVYKNEMPNYESLFKNMGVLLTKNDTQVTFGANLSEQKIAGYPAFDSPAYNARLTKGDKIISIDLVSLNPSSNLRELLRNYKPNDAIKVIFERYGETKETLVILTKNENYIFSLFENSGIEYSEKMKNNRADWLDAK